MCLNDDDMLLEDNEPNNPPQDVRYMGEPIYDFAGALVTVLAVADRNRAYVQIVDAFPKKHNLGSKELTSTAVYFNKEKLRQLLDQLQAVYEIIE